MSQCEGCLRLLSRRLAENEHEDEGEDDFVGNGAFAMW
jgi:hypothetical protein